MLPVDGLIESPKMLDNDAENDYREIRESDVLFAIMTDPYRGTFTEIGYATALGKKIIVWCPGKGVCKQLIQGDNDVNCNEEGPSTPVWEYSYNCMYNVFYHHRTIHHVSTFLEGVTYLRSLNKLNYPTH
jgi:hypothetical protein